MSDPVIGVSSPGGPVGPAILLPLLKNLDVSIVFSKVIWVVVDRYVTVSKS